MVLVWRKKYGGVNFTAAKTLKSGDKKYISVSYSSAAVFFKGKGKSQCCD